MTIEEVMNKFQGQLDMIADLGIQSKKTKRAVAEIILEREFYKDKSDFLEKKINDTLNSRINRLERLVISLLFTKKDKNKDEKNIKYIPLNNKHLLTDQEKYNKLLISKQEEEIKELKIINNNLRKELDSIRNKFPRVFEVEIKGSRPDTFEWDQYGFIQKK